MPRHAARVNRGGSWNNNEAARLRGANRNRNTPTNRNENLGFRCARTAAPVRVGVKAPAPVLDRPAAWGPRRR
ncbi:SUMF1/EgtB/PvdO family nonheme iron enzyme [Myxococcota bacterium]|nr:SUMF1/EgtB/PvdO family nonheme iron enzyme [Myxococcota bacterium]